MKVCIEAFAFFAGVAYVDGEVIVQPYVGADIHINMEKERVGDVQGD